MRICSFVPSGTEILFALGLGEQIVGVTHECVVPSSGRAIPKVVDTSIAHDHFSSAEIDQAVQTAMRRHEGLYRVDAEALRQARPDLIVTQSLCEVCAIGPGEVSEAVRLLSYQPRVVSLHAHTLTEALEEIRRVGEGTGRLAEAEALLEQARQRLDRVRELIGRDAARPRVFCLEWLAPLMASGHWVPEMVELAGGTEVLGRVGEPSRYVSAEHVVAARPEVLVLMPCGFPIERTRRELPVLTNQPWWKELPAVRQERAFLVDGPTYFNSSGPRLVDGVELLAGLFHPEMCAELIPAGSSEALA